MKTLNRAVLANSASLVMMASVGAEMVGGSEAPALPAAESVSNSTGTEVPAVATTIFASNIFFKKWAADSKGHKDLLDLAKRGVIADFAKDVEVIKEEDGKESYKRRTLNFNVTTLDCSKVLADSGMSAAQIDHAQELVNAAIKKDIQAMVVDAERTTPVLEADLPTWETVLSQPFNKRPTAIKVTMEMVNAAIKPLTEFLTAAKVQEGGINLTKDLCTKKFSIASLNNFETNIIEKVQSLVFGWFESLTESEQQQHFAVVDLWDKNIEAKLNPKKEDISIDMF